MWYIMQKEYGFQRQIPKTVLADMEKSVGWVSILAKPKEFEKDNPTRILDFETPYKIR